MTTTGSVGGAVTADPTPRQVLAARARTLRPDRATWPLWATTAAMPLAYAIGVHGFVWCLPGLVFGLRILSDRSTRFPLSSAPLVVFVGWILLSTSVLPNAGGFLTFGYRWLLFAGILTTMVWIANVPESSVPSSQIVDWMAALWIALVAFGFCGILLPNLDMKSPFQIALGPLGNNAFFGELSRWRFAETQGFLGYPLPRPAAPFIATNGWGSAMGILTPFFIQSWLVDADAKRRKRGILIGIAGLYPMVLSVNRGLWVALAVALIYFAAHKALRGRFGAFFVLLSTMVAVVGILALTPAGGLVSDRLANSERSNDSRSTLYEEAFARAQESPLVGWGATMKVPGAPENMPPVGTHGLLWYLMFVHGFVALFLFLGWLFTEVLRSGRIRHTQAWWAHLALVIGLVEVPFYGLLPQVVLIGVAAGLAHREDLR